MSGTRAMERQGPNAESVDNHTNALGSIPIPAGHRTHMGTWENTDV